MQRRWEEEVRNCLWPSALSFTYPSPPLSFVLPAPPPHQSCFPCGSADKESACNVRDLGFIPGLGRSPGDGKGYPFQHSGLENSMGSQRAGHDWAICTIFFPSLNSVFTSLTVHFYSFFFFASPLLGKPDLSFPQTIKPMLLQWKLGVLSTGSPGKFYAFPVLVFTETLLPSVHTTTTLQACFEQRNPCFHCQKGRVLGSWHPKWGSWMLFPIEISLSLLVL